MAIDNVDHIENTEGSSSDSTRKYQKNIHAQRTESTRRIKIAVLKILKWENPMRSGVILFCLIGSIILTGSYSLLEIVSMALTICISLNLLYVFVTYLLTKMVADKSSANPYSHILENKENDLINKENVIHYSSIGVDIAETIARALTRIIFIENTKTSVKWLFIFFTTWKISAFVSSRAILTTFIVSAFILPRLYISNKDLIDARIQQTEAIMNTQIQRTQEFANEKIFKAKSTAKDFYQTKIDATAKKVN